MPDSFPARFKPGLYITLVALAALTAYGYSLRKDGIFSSCFTQLTRIDNHLFFPAVKNVYLPGI